jgi:hypothetical protein
MIVTAPARIRKYEANKGSRLLPSSCTLYVYDNFFNCIDFCTRALRNGAGVKVVFPENFELDQPREIQLTRVYSYAEADMVVEDSLNSFLEVMHNLRSGKIFMNMRPADEKASGPDSFYACYEVFCRYLANPSIYGLLYALGTLNEVVKKGGYKRGIITSSMPTTCKYFEEYAKCRIYDIPGAHKKSIIVHSLEKADLILDTIRKDSTFLEKPAFDGSYANVCVGIYLKHRGTCLIYRINLAQVTHFDEIPEAMVEGMARLIALREEWRKSSNEDVSIYRPLEEDRQVALDMMGLANLLCLEGITYAEFVDTLEKLDILDSLPDTKSKRLVQALVKGYELSKAVALQAGLERAHCIEPAQSHAYEEVDRTGMYTVCRGIWAPLGQLVERQSETFGSQTYWHGPVETAAQLGPELHFRLCNAWQKLMNRHGLPHAISYDNYFKPDLDMLTNWYNSDLRTVYYNFSEVISQQYLRKTVELVDTECSACAE